MFFFRVELFGCGTLFSLEVDYSTVAWNGILDLP